MKKLSADEVAALAQRLPQWCLHDDGSALTRHFAFDDFAQAFAFMAHMALHSERLNHHPDWSNVYRHVKVTLSTHDAQGLTSLDEAWAQAADAYCAQPSPGLA